MTSYRKANERHYDQLEGYQSDAPHATNLAQRLAAFIIVLVIFLIQWPRLSLTVVNPSTLDGFQRCRAARALRRVYEFKEDETVVMDFACGVGLLSRELIPYAKTIVGVDISQRMVDEYNRRVSNQGIDLQEMRAVRADILDSSSDELQNMEDMFHVVVCSASYHHFDDITAITRALTVFLKPGGSIFVIDILKDDNFDVDEVFPEHREHNVVAHRGGFEKVQIEEAFQSAGLSSFELRIAIRANRSGHPINLFVARGRKLIEPKDERCT